MVIKYFSPLIALSLIGIPILSADTPEVCPNRVRSNRFTVSHIEGGGIGYDQGYTSLEGFFAPNTKQLLPFVDLRGHIFDNGKLAANAGLGLRYLSNHCRIFGTNIYYDFRQTQHKDFHQVGPGLEFFGKVWEFRANGYFPVGKTSTSLFDTKFKKFSGHSIFLQSRQQVAMKGGNVEVGGHVLRRKNWDLFLGAGPYYFSAAHGRHTWGGEGRFSVKFKQYAEVELISSYDSIFHEKFQGVVKFSLPLGPKAKIRKKEKGCFASCSRAAQMRESLVQPPVRQEIIVVDKHCKISPAINPLTGLPYYVWFVNNDPSGDGTFENPFSTLAQAEMASSPNDIIYVFSGNGTFMGMDAGIQLKDFQRLWGSGVPHPLPTTLGTIPIPALTSTLPLITNLSGTIVALANNNEVSGLHLEGTSAGTIGVFGNNINGLTFTDNILTSTVSQTDIGLSDAAGTILIANNSFSTSILDSGSVGLFISTSGSIVSSLTLFNNTFTGHGGAGGYLFYGDTVIGRATISKNTLIAPAGFPNTIGLAAIGNNSASLQFYVDGNTFLNHENVAFFFNSNDTSTISYIISNNVATLGIVNGSSYGLAGLLSDSSLQTGIFVNNTVNQSSNIDMLFDNEGSATEATVTFMNNTVKNGGQALPGIGGGIGVAVIANGSVKASVIGNACIDNLVDGGVVSVMIGTGTICLDMQQNFSNSTPGYFLFNLGGGPLKVESFDGALSGVQAVNTGTVTTSGTIIFVPTCDN